nr:MAG TPA: T-antigen specific domain protein [Caudoviricetes sp.]
MFPIRKFINLYKSWVWKKCYCFYCKFLYRNY